MRKRFAILFLSALTIAAGVIAIVVYASNLANETALAYNNTYTLDVNNRGIETLSAQAVYAQAAPAAVSFIDGHVSTMTITVTTNGSLAAAPATDKVTVVTNSALTNATLTFNGTALREGTDWSKGTVSSNTALSITQALNRKFPALIIATVPTSGTIIYSTAIANGSFANNFTLASSTQAALLVNSATFINGQDPARVIINGVALVNGVNWTAGTTSSATAKAISDAIVANSSLSPIITSTWNAAGVVSATSTTTGLSTNYVIASSTQAALTLQPTSAMAGGTDSNVLTTSSQINKANAFTTGLAVLYTKTAGTSPGQLVANTTYYAIAVDSTHFKLASSTTNAVAGTAVAITTQTTTGAGTFALTPLTYAGTASFKWQISNDRTNWSDLGVSSITYSSPSTTATNTVWDFGSVNYHYIRLNVIAPTAGGLYLVVTMNGSNSNAK